MSQLGERRFLLDGLVVELAARGTLDAHDLGGDALASLGPLVEGLADAPGGSAPPDLRVDVRFGDPASAPDPTEPSFFHGGVRVGRLHQGWVLRDGVCWARVDALTRPILVEARVPPGRHHLAGFVRTTLFVALVLALRELGRFHLHGALVRDAARTWLLVGPSGSGKSTTTVALAAAGLEPMADDAVLVASDGGVVPLARAFHLTERSLAPFPALRARVQGRHADKHTLTVAVSRPERLAVTGIVTLLGAGPHTEAAPVDVATTLGRLLEASALAVVEGATNVEQHLGALRRLVSRAACVELRPGPDALESPPLLLARLVEALGRAEQTPR